MDLSKPTHPACEEPGSSISETNLPGSSEDETRNACVKTGGWKHSVLIKGDLLSMESSIPLVGRCKDLSREGLMN